MKAQILFEFIVVLAIAAAFIIAIAVMAGHLIETGSAGFVNVTHISGTYAGIFAR